ncbi:MAG: folate-binding protein YgfZ [Candidatus Accumulibacter sp.]|jgi:folate-binding protein YgfZ|nr:folate-binding protein YgfZ [Accumulibacter sp.]
MQNISWLEFLADSGARALSGNADIAFDDETAESAAARDSTVVCPLTHLGLIAFSGDDAKTYLHNLLTSDVNRLEDCALQYSAWCSPKGRILSNFILCRADGAYRALLSAGLIETTLKRLRMYVLRSKVTLTEEPAALIGLSGPEAAGILTALALPAPESGAAAFDGGTLLRLDPLRYIVTAETDRAIELWEKIERKAPPVGNSAWRWLDIRAGIPLITEASAEKFVPQMIGLDKIGGVSFTKGCYPGQEIVARSHYLGQIKRHLCRLHLTLGETPRAGEDIFDSENAGTACGTLICAAPSPQGGFDALAVLKDEAAWPGRLHLNGGQIFDSVEAVDFPAESQNSPKTNSG